MPLNFDMSIEQLYKYKGTNPCPENFDTFWNQSLKEINTIDPETHITEAEFPCSFADCYHLKFTGTFNARIYAKLLRPKHKSGNQPAVLCFHGYTGNSGDWTALLPLAAAGFTVAAMDCRGQGGFSQDTGGQQGTSLHGHIIRGLESAISGEPEKLLYRNIFLDTVQLSRVVKNLPGVDPERIASTGWSQGGALALACAALDTTIKFTLPVYPFLSDYKRVWSLDLNQQAYIGIREFFRHHNPTHSMADKVFTSLGYIDIQFLAPRIKAKTLMSTSMMDTTCPPSSQFAAYNKINSKKEIILYPDFGHEPLPGLKDRIFTEICSTMQAP